MSTTDQPQFKRILLKLSGEVLAGGQGAGIDPGQAAVIAGKIKLIHDMGIEVGLVIGAGSLWRGNIGVQHGMAQPTADHMGMLATVMNGLALQDALERVGVPTRVQTAIAMNQVAEPYIRLRAIRHMEKGRVVIIAGGTGNPYFTTDTAAALRAMEIDAEVLIKGTQVDGIYTADPKKDPTAKKFDQLSYSDALKYRVRVMDLPFAGSSETAYARSGIADAVQAAGGEMEVMNQAKFRETQIPEGQDIKSWPVYQEVLNANVLINVPTAKDHNATRLSLGCKNLMGVILRPNQLHANLHQRIADLTSLVRPTLTVVDAVRTLMAHGPTGGNLGDVRLNETVIASHDIVAADAYAATLFDLTGEEIPFLKAAADMGLGMLDLGSIKIEEVAV